MPTAKKRVNLTMDDELFGALEKLSKKQNIPVTSLSLKLIEKAMEIEEDVYFSRVGDERLSAKSKRISHDEAWKD